MVVKGVTYVIAFLLLSTICGFSAWEKTQDTNIYTDTYEVRRGLGEVSYLSYMNSSNTFISYQDESFVHSGQVDTLMGASGWFFLNPDTQTLSLRNKGGGELVQEWDMALYVQAKLMTERDGRVVVSHESGLAALRFSEDDSDPFTSLLTHTGSTLGATAFASSLVVVYRDTSGSTLLSESFDHGESWDSSVVSTTLSSSDTLITLSEENATLSLFFLKNGEMIVLYRCEGESEWRQRSSGIYPDGESPSLYREEYGGMFFLSSLQGVAALSYSTDGAQTWTSQEISSWEGNLIGVDYSFSGNVQFWSDGGYCYTHDNPLELISLSEVYSSSYGSGHRVEWTEHPWADSYALELNGVSVGSIASPPWNYGAGFVPGSNVRIRPLREGKEGASFGFISTEGERVQQDYLHNAGTRGTDFRMVSYPSGAYIEEDTQRYTPKSYLEKYLGPEYDPYIWRLGRWNPLGFAYDMGTEFDDMHPEHSYWLLSAWNFSYTVQYSRPREDTALVRLSPGWNMIGSPFEQSLVWAHSSVRDGFRGWGFSELAECPVSPLLPILWEWDGEEYRQAEKLDLGKGYWVKNRRSTELMLFLTRSAPLEKSFSSVPYFAGKEELPPDPPGIGESSVSASGGGGCLFR